MIIELCITDMTPIKTKQNNYFSETGKTAVVINFNFLYPENVSSVLKYRLVLWKGNGFPWKFKFLIPHGYDEILLTAQFSIKCYFE